MTMQYEERAKIKDEVRKIIERQLKMQAYDDFHYVKEMTEEYSNQQNEEPGQLTE